MGMVSHVWSLLMIVAVNAIWSFCSLPCKSPCVMCKSSSWICHGFQSCVNFSGWSMDWFTGSCTGSPNNISWEKPWFPVKMFPSTNEAIPICLKINPNDPMNHHVSWLTPILQYCSWNIFLINWQVFGTFDQQVACKPFTTARQALPVAWPSVSGHYTRGFPGKSGENPWWMEVWMGNSTINIYKRY